MIYLDNGATSYPKPGLVYDAIAHVLRAVGGNPGRSSHRMAVEAARVVFTARESAARLINAGESSCIAWTKNATEAINAGIKGFLRPGDHVVTTSFEHNSVVKALKRSAVAVTAVRPGKHGFLSPEKIKDALTASTKLVVLTHASNVIGSLQPIAEIGAVCRKKGVVLMVDAAQTLGAMTVDVEAMNIGMLAATGHKALFGPQGTGFLYVRHGIELSPLIDGGTGEDDSAVDMPEILEAGTLNTPGIAGLGAGIEFILSEGIDRIRAKEDGFIREIISMLKAIKGVSIIGTEDAGKRASLLSFNIKGIDAIDAGILYDERFSIMIRCGTHCAPMAHKEAGTFPNGAIRVSPGYFNTPDEIDAFIKATEIIAGA
ncbi:MAG: aminotransferase class V-fold PLP-dependent enzyme [Deltaproteobacteria bacterium]|nr:aminotransferase class V-fold PLP-dependent enzyme [Deltaproteobacteria bacterium]